MIKNETEKAEKAEKADKADKAEKAEKTKMLQIEFEMLLLSGENVSLKDIEIVHTIVDFYG